MLDVEVLYLIGDSSSTNIVKVHEEIELDKPIKKVIM